MLKGDNKIMKIIKEEILKIAKENVIRKMVKQDKELILDIKTISLSPVMIKIDTNNKEGNLIIENEVINRLLKELSLMNNDIIATNFLFGEYGLVLIIFNSKMKIKNNKLISEYKEKIKSLEYSLKKIDQNIYEQIKSHKSKTKTCKECNSSINVSFFKSHLCPVCGTQLYTNTDKERILKIQNKISEFYNKIETIKNIDI